jgi:hypothetical protein
MKYAPFLPVLIVLVVLMAGPGMRRVRAGESILITVGGFLLLAILFSWILFRSS